MSGQNGEALLPGALANTLFVSCLACRRACPHKSPVALRQMYANLEEEYGLVRHAMNIYDRATKAVDDADKFEVYQISIKKAAEYFGVTHTRDIFERAIEVRGKREHY